MGLLQRQMGIERNIFALDMYGGMPAPQEKDGETIYQAGLFANNPLPVVEALVEQYKLGGMIHLVKGLVEENVEIVVRKHSGRVAFAFLDTDQYSGTAAGLKHVLPDLMEDGMIVIDDTTVSGVNQAIEEALQAYPEMARLDLMMNFVLLIKKESRGIYQALPCVTTMAASVDKGESSAKK